MKASTCHAIGLMSGTSLDGVDLCYVRFETDAPYKFKILSTATVAYDQNWIKKLKEAFNSEPSHLKELDRDYGKYLAKLLNEFIFKNAIVELDFIASHGHTIFHKPEQGYTLQIGNGKTISKLTGQKVICDFRSQDLLLGGQGAPLVPIGDQLLFNQYDACLNLGGFANVSYTDNEKRIAFDICPVNIVLNYYSNKLGLDYDDKGQVAKSGQFDQALFNDLNQLDYYSLPAPKSLGFEWVNKVIIPMIEKYDIENKDILRTFIEHAAFQISKTLKPSSKLLITGGGAFNTFLMRRIEHYAGRQIELPQKELINYKEALVFAFLGLLRSKDRINVLASVTGAKENHSSGLIFET